MSGRQAEHEALRIASDHGVDRNRLLAYGGLARSRGVGLDVVLRAAMRGDLRDIVTLPACSHPPDEQAALP